MATQRDFVLSKNPLMPPKPKNQPKPQPKQKGAPRVKKPLKEGFFKRNSFAIGLFLITFIVFANGINNEYALDDEFYTAGGNKLTQKGIKGIPEIFKSHTFYNNDGSGYSYRPVALTTFAIETQFFGEDPHVSHFFSILLYALTIVLIFSLLRKWFVTQGDWFSFFVCLVFIVHPLHTEVVDNIKCRDELLAIFFTMLTIWGIWKHLETKKWIFLVAYPLFFWAGMLSKHTAIPFYVLIPLTLWFFTNTKIWKIALYVAPLFLSTIITFFLKKQGLADESRTYLPFENPLVGHPGFAELSATSFYVLGRYLFLHFIPHPLVYYYGSFYVPTVTWSNPIAIASLLVHAGLGIWALKELRKKSILGFGLLFYLINIAAYSNLLQRAPGIMAERYTYSASLGFCIVIISLIFRFMKVDAAGFRWKLEDYKKVKFVILGIAVLFTVRTFIRTNNWEDKDTLYGHDMEYLENSVKANMLYGALISKHALEANMQSRLSDGRGGMQIDKQKQDEAMRLFTEARGYYKKAAEMAPYYHTAWSNLGTAHFFTGETKTAISYFWKGVSIKKDYAEGWFNIGMAYDKLSTDTAYDKIEMKDSSVYAFSQSIKSDSNYIESYEQLSRIRMQKENNPDAALNLLRRAALHRPQSESPWTNMAGIYLQLKDSVNYEASMEMAARINPENLRVIGNLAQYYQGKKDYIKFNQYASQAQILQKKQQELQRKQQEKMQR